MARPLRLDVPLVPQHVIVRGVNRQACFNASGDFACYIDDLSFSARRHACAIHAYVLMTNHIHLLLTGQVPGAVSRLVQSVGRLYVPRFNASWNRTGTLFECRFRASIVESERYFMSCMRYIELNPVRAGMVEAPLDYRWSSVHANTGVRQDPLITFHDEYRRLGSDDSERASAYRDILNEGLDAVEIETIRRRVNRDRVLGSPTFELMIACTSPQRGKIVTALRRLRSDVI